MNILNFEGKHIKEAERIALANYNEEQQHVKELPQVGNIPGFNHFAENGLGIAAFENQEMLGFMCCYKPCSNVFGSTDAKGVFSPMGANGAVFTNRAKIYAAMYQAAGAKWVKAGAASHAICLYAHDEKLQQQFYCYGFGLRCWDAIRPMELIDCKPCADYDFVEIEREEYRLVYMLNLALNRHCQKSPFFMNRKPTTQKEFILSSVKNERRYFGAKQNGKLCAFLEISASGETFAAMGSACCHISGAYCLPEHRGKDVYQNLLNFAISVLKAEGYMKLGVDFESFNPTAHGFWMKYFTAYTHGVVRRIDERILLMKG